MFNFLGFIALALSVIVAMRWGGLDERLAATGFLLATAASRFVTAQAYGETEVGILMVDSTLLFGLIVLALRSDRFWPMWAAAFQLVGTTVHLASMTESGDFAKAYGVGLIFWSYPVLLTLMIGTWLEGRFRGAWR